MPEVMDVRTHQWYLRERPERKSKRAVFDRARPEKTHAAYSRCYCPGHGARVPPSLQSHLL